MLSVEEKPEDMQADIPDIQSSEAPNNSTKKLDEESRKRGRRMMGVLMGTLSKFKKNDASDSTGIRQRQIQTKLMEKLAEERALLAEQVERERAERLAAIRAQETKHLEESEAEMQRIKQLNDRAQRNFLKTKTVGAPVLFYLPAVLLESQEELLRKQQEDMFD